MMSVFGTAAQTVFEHPLQIGLILLTLGALIGSLSEYSLFSVADLLLDRSPKTLAVVAGSIVVVGILALAV